MAVIQLESFEKSVEAIIVPELGATVSSLKFQGREALFLHDHFWDKNDRRTRGGIPFLFPICGRLEDGAMPIHGFAMRKPWTTVGRSKENVVLQLKDDDETRAVYPHSFEVTLNYRVGPCEFACEQIYTNTGNQPMPYYAGFHPYFHVAEKEKAKLFFEAERCWRYNEKYTDFAEEISIPKQPIKITNEINHFISRLTRPRQSVALQFDDMLISMTTDFPYLQLYTMTDQPFVCVEPWMAPPNALNTKRDLRWLAPGKSERANFSLKFQTLEEKF